MLLLLLPVALAGDPGPLCDAVATSDAVVEVHVRSVGAWPATYQSRGWEPPDEAVQPTVDTATVRRALKGDATGWTPTRADLGFQNKPVAWWTRFYSGEEFEVLAMLKRDEAGTLRAHGWLADRGDCHVSWCWEELRGQVLACLAAQGVQVPAE